MRPLARSVDLIARKPCRGDPLVVRPFHVLLVVVESHCGIYLLLRTVCVTFMSEGAILPASWAGVVHGNVIKKSALASHSAMSSVVLRMMIATPATLALRGVALLLYHRVESYSSILPVDCLGLSSTGCVLGYACRLLPSSFM